MRGVQLFSYTHFFIFLTDMSLENFMALSAAHSPRFKVQATDWPLNVALLYLPQSIALLLSNLCGTSEDVIKMLWTFTNQIIWEYSGRAKEIDKRFKMHGKDLGYR